MDQQTLDQWEWRLLMRDVDIKQRLAKLHENRAVLTTPEYLHQISEITKELQQLARDYEAFNAAVDEHYAAAEIAQRYRPTPASTESKNAFAAEPPPVSLGTGRDPSGVGGGWLWLWFMAIAAFFTALAGILKAILGHNGPTDPNDGDRGRL